MGVIERRKFQTTDKPNLSEARTPRPDGKYGYSAPRQSPISRTNSAFSLIMNSTQIHNGPPASHKTQHTLENVYRAFVNSFEKLHAVQVAEHIWRIEIGYKDLASASGCCVHSMAGTIQELANH